MIWRSFSPALNISGRTHLRLALKSSHENAHHNFQIKLVNQGSSREHIYWLVAESVADLPTWRPLYFDLREFTCFGDEATCDTQPELDPGAITRIEFAVGRCRKTNGEECEPGADQAELFIDELAAVDLRPGAPHRLVQTQFRWAASDGDLRASAAGAIKAHQDPDEALLPAWFEEEPPKYNVYSQAGALHVFVDEYHRTAVGDFKTAAERLADALLDLQIPADRVNSGAWFTEYKLVADTLVPADETCTGDETATEDIDRCSWVANTAWAVIALNRLRHSEISYDRAEDLDASIARAASWMISQIGRIEEFPDLITVGLEGNISSYFGLLADQEQAEADDLGAAIYQHGWDPTQQRMKIGAGPADFATAMDTAGSWGTTLLRCLGKDEEALSSQGYAATVLRTTSFDNDNVAHRLVDGYGDIAGPFTIASEFGAQGAAVGILHSSHVMEELSELQSSEGAFPGSTDNWYGGQVPPWATTWTGVAPTAWIYFAQNRDPLLPLCLAGEPDLDEDGVGDFRDNCVEVVNGPLLRDAGGNSQLDTDGDDYGNVCDCDFDQGGEGNIEDFNIFLPDFVSGTDSGVGTDMDGNGLVGIDQLQPVPALLRRWGPGPSDWFRTGRLS